MNPKLAALLVSIVIVFFAWCPGVLAQSDDAALAARLVSGSPWKGAWTFEAPGSQLRGELHLDFVVNGGQLEGRVSNVSPANSGPVNSLMVKQESVRFVTKGGVSMQLKIAPDGRLKGTGSGPRGGTAEWDLTPSK